MVCGASGNEATNWCKMYQASDFNSFAKAKAFIHDLRIPIPVWLAVSEIAAYNLLGSTWLITDLGYRAALVAAFLLAIGLSASSRRRMLWSLAICSFHRAWPEAKTPALKAVYQYIATHPWKSAKRVVALLGVFVSAKPVIYGHHPKNWVFWLYRPLVWLTIGSIFWYTLLLAVGFFRYRFALLGVPENMLILITFFFICFQAIGENGEQRGFSLPSCRFSRRCHSPDAPASSGKPPSLRRLWQQLSRPPALSRHKRCPPCVRRTLGVGKGRPFPKWPNVIDRSGGRSGEAPIAVGPRELPCRQIFTDQFSPHKPNNEEHRFAALVLRH